MKLSSILISLFFPASYSTLLERASAPPTFDESICSPNVTVSAGTILPPCTSIRNIQQQCQPNGTLPINYAAHAQCLCNAPSSFFTDWKACRKCLQVHGGLSEKNVNRYSVVINSVSSALCTGTPTAAFESLFKSVDGQVPMATSGASVTSDMFPGQTAVSLYYTASGPQGAGSITGNATAATKSTSKIATSAPPVSKDSATGTGSPSAAKPTSIASTPTSKSGALPTEKVGSGMLAAVVGGVIMALS